MKTAISKPDKRKLVFKQEPLSAGQIKHLESKFDPVDPVIFMAKSKEAARQPARPETVIPARS